MTTRGPTAAEEIMNAVTNAAIQLARLKVRRYEPESPAAVAIEEAWVVVREAFVAQVPAGEQAGLRLDLDELFENTKLHAYTEQQVSSRSKVAIRKA